MLSQQLQFFFLFGVCQAHQDILAQDLAEAIDSQVELAEQLRCYRQENEQLLNEKQEVCAGFILSGSVMQIQENVSAGMSHIGYSTAT